MATKESLRHRKVYLIHNYLGDDEIGTPTILSDSENDLKWLEHWKNEAKRHHHPNYKIMVETLEVVEVELLVPENPDPSFLEGE